MISREQLIREFSQALDDGEAALFAGAGLSVGAKLVDWRGLLRSVASDLDLDIDEEHDLIAVAQYEVNKSRSRHRLNKAILEEFNKHVEASNNHRLIAQMPFEVIWTTNYDSLIEDALKAAGRRYDVKGAVKRLALHVRKAEITLYKMHGDVSNPDEAVLTKDDYESYEFERSAFTDLLRSDLTRYTFLFLGFSFTDPNIEYVLARLRRMLLGVQKHHYCILRRPSEPTDPTKKEQHRRELAKFAHRIEDLKRFGIQTHVISEFRELDEILATLRNKSALKNVLVSGSAYDFSPLGRDRLERFSCKLGHQIIARGYNLVSGFGLNIGGACILGAYEAAQIGSVRSISERLFLRPLPQNLPPAQAETVFAPIRKDLVDSSGAVIFLAGNKLYAGESAPRVAEGVLQEYEMAKAAKRVLIPIPCTGHAAALIWNEMKPKLTELFADASVAADFAVLEDGTQSDGVLINAVFTILAKATKPNNAPVRMSYLTENQLREYSTRLRYDGVVLANAKSAGLLAQVTIFLSHSSKDRVLAQGLVYYLASLGISVYVDWNDSDLPRVANRETAEKLKGKIKDNRLFMILATKNALESKWVPWEVGIADQCKGESSMLLVPVADAGGRFEGSEYLQLYRHVETATAGGFGVFPPGESNGVLLETYVRIFGVIR